MACGDTLRHLAVTKSGYTPENPNGAFYLPGDYSEWQTLLDKVAGWVNAHIAELQAIEAQEGSGFVRFAPLSGEWTSFLRAKEALPNVLLAAGKDLPRVVDVVMQGLCLLEQIDEAISSYGAAAPELPSPGRDPKPPPLPSPSTIGNGVITLAIVAVLVGAGYFFLFKQGGDD